MPHVIYTPSSTPYLYQLDLNTGHTVNYTNYKIEHIIDMAFVKASKELLVAIKQPSVLSCRSGELRPRFIFNLSATQLVVDQVKPLVFMLVRTNRTRYSHLMTMTTEGKLLNIIRVNLVNFKAFDVDQQREIAYCITNKQLIAYDYKGRMKGVLRKKTYTTFVTVGDEGRTIYYGMHNILRYSIRTKSASFLMRHKKVKVKQFHVDGNGKAVATLWKQNSIFTVDLENRTISKLLTLSYEQTSDAPIVCLVP